MDDPFSPSLPSPVAHALRRELSLTDLALAQILNVVGSSWVGIAASLGRAQALVWIGSMLVFYAPMAISVYYLNGEMPLEGGLYVWARKAFGDLAGFLTAWNIWAYGLTVTASILYQLPTEIAYLAGPTLGWLPESRWAAFVLLGLFLSALIFAAIRGLSIGKWIHKLSSIAVLAVFAMLIGLPGWAMVRHMPLHWAPLEMQLPPMNLVSLALLGQMFGALSGLEYIAIMAGEAQAPAKNIGRSILVASPIVCAMFILGSSSVVAFAQLHPGIAIDYIAPIPQTLRWALGDTHPMGYLASGTILLLQIRLLGASSLLLTGVTRLPMTAGWDHLVPEWFARIDPRHRTPVNSILFSSAIVAFMLVFANLGVHAAEAFQTLSNTSSELYCLTYLVMFAIPVVGAAALRKRLPRWIAITSIAGFLSTIVSLVLTAFPFIPVAEPMAYAAKIAGTTVSINLLGLLFYRSRLPAQRLRLEVSSKSI